MACNFWYRVWSEAGYPSSGVLTQIKKHAKSRYKSEIRRLRRGQNRILRRNLASSLICSKEKLSFWSIVKSLNKDRASGKLQTVDGISEESGIAMESKLKTMLNTHSGLLSLL